MAGSTQQIIKNIIYGFSTWILPVVLSFIATPIVVKSLGNSDFGIYSLITGFVGYSYSFNFSRAVTKYLAETSVEDNLRRSEIISSTLFLNLFIGLTSVGIFVILTGWIVRDILQIEPEMQRKTVYAMNIGAVIIFVTMLNQLANAILQGIHRFDIYSKILNLSNLCLIVGNLIIAFSTENLIFLLVWNAVIVSLSGIIFIISVRKLLPDLKLLAFNWITVKLVVGFSLGIIGYQILAHLFLIFERVWVTRHFGTELLTFYVIPLVLAGYIQSFANSLVLVLMPLASELDNDREKLLRLYLKATKFVAIIVVFFAATMIIKNEIFLSLWIGGEFAEKSSSVMIIHIITFSLTAILVVAWQVTEGLNYPHYLFFGFTICFITGGFFMIGLTDPLQIFGIALGRMIGFAVLFSFLFFTEFKFFGKIQFGFWAKITGILTVAVFLTAAAEIYVGRFLSENWLSLVISSAAGLFVYAAVILISGLIGKEEKRLLYSFVGTK